MSNIILTISHNIFLTRDERYSLHEGEDLEVLGVSVPVWVYDGGTTEPASEIFCKYKLLNRERKVSIKTNPTCYEISIPKTSKVSPTGMPQSLWNNLSLEEKQMWKYTESNLNLGTLLDITDGGSEFLVFKQYNKSRKRGLSINLIHFVEIKDISELVENIS